MKEYRGTRLLGNQVTVKDDSGVRWLPRMRSELCSLRSDETDSLYVLMGE